MSAAQLGYNYIDHGGGAYTVLSPSRERYEVDIEKPSCSCPDFIYRGEQTGDCKHIRFVKECERRSKLSGVDALTPEQRQAYDTIINAGCEIEEVTPGRWLVRMPGSPRRSRGTGSPSEKFPGLAEAVLNRLYGRR